MFKPEPDITCLRLALAAGLALPLLARADFIDDSQGSLELRNFYQNRDFRQTDAAKSQVGNWSQAFMLRMQSGFTEGPVGFGLDYLGVLGVKFDSGRGRSGDGTLPFGAQSGRPVDDFSHMGVTGKVRVSKTRLDVGILTPTLPVVFRDDMRLMPQTFDGALVESREIDRLTLTAGQLWRSRTRESSGSDRMYLAGRSADFDSGAFDVLGASYNVGHGLVASVFRGELHDVYRQDFYGLVHTLPLGTGMSLLTDMRYFDSNSAGTAKAGSVDNRNFNMMSTLSLGAHKVGVGYQRMYGSDAFPTLNGYTPPYTVNLVTIGTFTSAEEVSWQARYDYNFVALGLPGLTFMTRYVRGDDIRTSTGNGHEWERDTDLAYVIQSGALQGLALRWRNAAYRSSYASDMDENRLILSYTLNLW
ncbi:outer membrane porin, OprD family [Pseudomonas hunanensis]|uniref:Outer membrane porin, OprD family n=1 Tax=Pseudomonas hunanensis TaxID=1247546 RepID=A0ABD6N3V9_9PSED|nr:OprD family porin [Pseudomonas hunanensis]NWL47473.1 outer membrane porin, OprD family [Pseudomonas hunanensis]